MISGMISLRRIDRARMSTPQQVLDSEARPAAQIEEEEATSQGITYYSHDQVPRSAA